MNDFVIMADSTCDIDRKTAAEYGIVVVPGHLIFPGNKEIVTFLDWDMVSREDFYTDLKKRPEEYGTSPTNAEEFRQAMLPYAAEGKNILLMTISSGISGAFGFATQAKKEIEAEYHVTVQVIDSLRFGPGFGLMVINASLLRSAGKSFEEVGAWIEANKNRFHQAGWLDDLSFVARKGRLTHAKAFFGTLAGIKPIGEFDYNGLTTVIGKVKGAKKAYSVLLSYIEETIEDPEDQIIIIAQTNRLPQAEEYKKLIEDKFHPKAVYIRDVYPICGINVGPGLMAAYYMGKPITEGLTAEQAIIEKYNV